MFSSTPFIVGGAEVSSPARPPRTLSPDLSGLRLQPLMKAWLLRGAHLDAVVHAIDGLGEGTFGGVHLVGGEEACDLIALLDAAEIPRCSHDAHAGVRGELRMHLVPVLPDVGPGLLAGLAITQQRDQNSPTILRANLARH